MDLANPFGLDLHANISELKKCAPTCYLCRQGYNAACIAKPVGSMPEYNAVDPDCLEDKDHPDSYCVVARYNNADPLDRSTVNRQGFEVVVCKTNDERQRVLLTEPEHWVYAWFLEGGGQVFPSVPRLRQLPKTTSAPSTLELARQWTLDCISGSCCGFHTGRDPITASRGFQRRLRLLRILGDGIVQLVDSDITSTTYVALSYTWGSVKAPWKTIRSNISTRQHGFGIQELPKTLVDAVHITCAIQVQYLWVDSICIIQDDIEDWAKEAEKMADIYLGAYLTIAADSSRDSYAGIFNHAFGSKAHFDGLEFSGITDVDEGGATTTLLLYSEGPEDQWFDTIENSTLSRRGWCCQESILSPRILHFTDTQLFWECCHCVRSEDGYFYKDRRPENTDLRDLKSMIFPSTLDNKLLHDMRLPQQLRPGSTAKSLIRLWYHTVIERDYSARQLTRGSDKLVAVGGIARTIQWLYPMRYFAGLWEESLVEGLCWSRTITNQTGSKADEYLAPSWSWASQDGQISCHIPRANTDTRAIYARVESIDVTRMTDDECGSVSDGLLELQAPTLFGRSIKRKDGEPRYRIDPQLEEDWGLPCGEGWYDVPPPDVWDRFVQPGESDPRSETVLELENGDWLTVVMDDPATKVATVNACLMFESGYTLANLPEGEQRVRLHFVLLQETGNTNAYCVRVGYAAGEYSLSKWESRKAIVMDALQMSSFTIH